MTTIDAAAAVSPGGRARPLTDGELAAAWWTGAAAAGLGVLGFANSFAAVARAAQSSFGQLAPTVPLGIDLAIAVFSAMDIVLARLDMRPRWVRLVPWSLTGATVYLNIAGQVTWFGRVAHAVFPALWVIAVSLAAHVIRVRAHLASGTAIDRIRVSRWLLAPLPTARLWRRMVLWEIRSYPAALDRERARLLALTGLQDDYGAVAWRWKAPRRVRALYRLGEHGAAAPAGDGVTAGATPAGAAGDDSGRTRLTAVREPEPARAGIAPYPDDAGADSGGPAGGTARTEEDGQPGEVDRDAVVARIADQIRDAVEAGERWQPDSAWYSALMAETGYKRRWCERVVSDARNQILDPPPGPGSVDGTVTPGTTPAGDRADDGSARAGSRAGEPATGTRTGPAPGGEGARTDESPEAA